MPKGVPYPSARRTRRRNERNERARAGVPASLYNDWRCHICKGSYSRYRGRNLIHLRSCEAKRARRIAREEKLRRRVEPLPSPDRFSSYESVPDADLTISWSPTREPSIVGDAEQDSESYLEDGHEYLVESLSNTFTPLVPDQAPGGDESLGEFYIAFNEI